MPIPAAVKKGYRYIHRQLVEINDTPYRKAMGLGLGVFLGIFPGTGPIAALAASAVLKVNKAAALLGSLLTNTWLSVVTFMLAVKAGAKLTGAHWPAIYAQTKIYWENFSWRGIFDVSAAQILYPLFLGYILVGLCLGIATTLLAALILRFSYKSGA